MKIIPAIDLINGQCVRLHQGQYNEQKIYSANPVEMAQTFEAAGFNFLHVVDLDGAKAGATQQYNIIERIAKETNLKIDVGGGITSTAIAEKLFKVGVQQINIGSLAIKNPILFKEMLQQFGSEKIILSADVLEGIVKISGWLQDGGVTVQHLIEQFLGDGLSYVCCTDISKDGTLNGTSIELYKTLQHQFSDIKIIASGGVGVLKDVEDLLPLQLEGVIVGKAIYENKITLNELVNLNHA
jgi:phosphoribosylformimino-5-aminoimidazole carboxamide ribotide isomerase